MRILKNVMPELPPAIAFRLRGTKSNRDAIGAAIAIETSAGRQTRILQAGSGFLSQHSKELFFGLGKANGPVHASIRWPSGAVQELRDLPVNHRIWIQEGLSSNRIEPFKTPLSIEPSAPRPRSGEMRKPGMGVPDKQTEDETGHDADLTRRRDDMQVGIDRVDVFPIAAAGPRTLQVAARYADTWNTFADFGLSHKAAVDVIRQRSELLDAACAKIGRDPAAIEMFKDHSAEIIKE